MISQRAKYAFKALVHLARLPPGASAQIGGIALGENIPRKFLEQILLALRNDGLIASRRGRSGGYYFVRTPEEVSLGHILRLMDGPIAPLACLSRSAYRRCTDCDESTCAVRRIFGDIFAATLLTLEGTTLADALRQQEPSVTFTGPA